MQEALVHRGPDGQGWHEEPHVSLAMRRLSILDPSGSGQPLYNSDRSVVVVYNGEIYNHRALRTELTQSGVRLRTRGDGEVIPHLYARLGVGFLTKLRGMFAIALWDRANKTLILARDRLGEKPLYYTMDGDTLKFASEQQALLCGGVGFDLSLPAVAEYLHYQYTIEPSSLIAGVKKVAPGGVVVVRLDGWSIKEAPYWTPDRIDPIDGDPVPLIRDEISTICRLMSVADRPVGVALSGGLDSGSIAAILPRHRTEPVHAFSLGFAGRASTDERVAARRHAEALGLVFHEIEVSEDEVVGQFPQLIAEMDEPVADMSAYAYRAIMVDCRRKAVPILFMGHGADELFWGYDWVRRAVQGLMSGGGGLAVATEEPRRVAGWPPWPLARALFGFHPDFRSGGLWCEGLHWFRSGTMGGTVENLRGPPCAPSRNLPLAVTTTLLKTYLMGNGINQMDRLSMASSVEVRLPFVDHRLVELVLGLRARSDDSRLGQKRWLREALRGMVPDGLRLQGKRPFEAPYRAWRAALMARYGDMLLDGYLVGAGILPAEVALRLRHEQPAPDVVVSVSHRALCLEMWCRRCVALAGRH